MADPWSDYLNRRRGDLPQGGGTPSAPPPLPSFQMPTSGFQTGAPGSGTQPSGTLSNAPNKPLDRLSMFGGGADGADGKLGLGRIQQDALGSGSSQVPLPGFQFDDAYTNLLESLAQRQLGEVRSNPGLDQLMQFLTSQFQDLSQNPGYNPAEQAMLRTQVFEPIEDYRNASKQRATERTAARGFGQSSGLHELDLRDIERAADRSRTVADRDLAIAGLDRRDKDLARALDLGQMLGLDIPRGQRAEEIGLGSLLYQLPRTAMMDALSIINGSPSSGDAFAQVLQLLQNQQNQRNYSNSQNSALFGQIGSMLSGLF